LPDQLVQGAAPQAPAAGQLTGIRTKANSEHSQAQVGDEEEPPSPTRTTWWTVDRCYQAALDQVRHV
jgi:hypothetical protein